MIYVRSREITWKEFVQQYLPTGSVERLEVINKQWVRVKFYPGAPLNNDSILWFNIGSIDSLERNLENAEMALQLSPQNYIPVVYKSEIAS